MIELEIVWLPGAGDGGGAAEPLGKWKQSQTFSLALVSDFLGFSWPLGLSTSCSECRAANLVEMDIYSS